MNTNQKQNQLHSRLHIAKANSNSTIMMKRRFNNISWPNKVKSTIQSHHTTPQPILSLIFSLALERDTKSLEESKCLH